MQSRLRALMFYVDGTLADTEEVHRQAFNAAFAEAGLDWVWSHERYHDLLSVTGGKERIRHYLDQDRPDFQLPADAGGFIAGLHRSKTGHYVGMLRKGQVPLRPGVERLIREAHASGLRLAIVTTTTPANVNALFEHSFGVHEDEWFELVAAGGVVPRKKPAPDNYNYAREQMGLKADECLALEDSGNGVLSARAAGIDVVITVNQYTNQHDFTDAAVVLDHLGEGPGQKADLGRRVGGGGGSFRIPIPGGHPLGGRSGRGDFRPGRAERPGRLTLRTTRITAFQHASSTGRQRPVVFSLSSRPSHCSLRPSTHPTD